MSFRAVLQIGLSVLLLVVVFGSSLILSFLLLSWQDAPFVLALQFLERVFHPLPFVWAVRSRHPCQRLGCSILLLPLVLVGLAFCWLVVISRQGFLPRLLFFNFKVNNWIAFEDFGCFLKLVNFEFFQHFLGWSQIFFQGCLGDVALLVLPLIHEVAVSALFQAFPAQSLLSV